MQRFLKFPIFIFLIFPIFIFHIFNLNHQVINTENILFPLFLSCIFSCFIYLFLRFGLKQIKYHFFGLILLICILFYGVQYDLVEYLYYKGYWPFEHIHRNLLVFQIILLISSFYFIKKSDRDFSNVTKTVNFITLVLFSFNFLSFGSKILFNKKEVVVIHKDIESKKYPNIYYVILDGYANETVLKKYYHFNNRHFIQSLEKLNFYVQKHSYSNYYGTNLSLGSTLNMNTKANNSIYNNQVFKILKKHNYKINIIKSGYSVTEKFENVDSYIETKGLNEIERTILNLTIFRLDDVIGNNIFNRINSQFDAFDKIPCKGNNFNFIHIVSPHPPFVFKRNGKKVTNLNNKKNYWEPKAMYVDQLEYISNRLLTKIKKIRKKDSTAIILIQSDHGPYITSKNKQNLFEARSMILNAIYANDQLKHRFKQTKSSVNTFIHVFNELFDAQLEKQKDIKIGKEIFLKDIRINKNCK